MNNPKTELKNIMSDKKSRDSQKLGKFYTFKVTPEKMNYAQTRVKSVYIKHLRNAFIFGFLIELMITKTRICICFSF
jgi:hypothetical protein